MNPMVKEAHVEIYRSFIDSTLYGSFVLNLYTISQHSLFFRQGYGERCKFNYDHALLHSNKV